MDFYRQDIRLTFHNQNKFLNQVLLLTEEIESYVTLMNDFMLKL